MSNIIAQKKNRVLQITPEKVDEYKKLGYTIKEDGKVIFEPQISIADANKQIEALTAQVAELTAALEDRDKQIEALTAQVAELTAVPDDSKADDKKAATSKNSSK